MMKLKELLESAVDNPLDWRKQLEIVKRLILLKKQALQSKCLPFLLHEIESRKYD